MSDPLEMPSREALLEVRALADRSLTSDEFERYVRAPMTDDERAEILSLHEWFTHRYATVAERFAYARRHRVRRRALARYR